MTVKPVPAGCRRVSPYLIVPDPGHLIGFLEKVFGARQLSRYDRPDGGVMHAEVAIGDNVIMMGGANDSWPPVPAAVNVYVEDVDAAYARALEAGATSIQAPADQFYGDRSAGVKDSCGCLWFIATRIEDLSEDEINRRHAERAGG